MEINGVKAIFSCHRSNASFPYYSIFKNSISSIDLDLRLIDLLIMMPMVNALFLFLILINLYTIYIVFFNLSRKATVRLQPGGTGSSTLYLLEQDGGEDGRQTERKLRLYKHLHDIPAH